MRRCQAATASEREAQSMCSLSREQQRRVRSLLVMRYPCSVISFYPARSRLSSGDDWRRRAHASRATSVVPVDVPRAAVENGTI